MFCLAVQTKTIVLGAHLDHLGVGKGPSSLAQGDEPDLVHYGADDNASGVATVIEAARLLSQHPADATYVFAAWSGEEVGLIGSQHFVETNKRPLKAYLNFDMVGRLRDGLALQGAGSSRAWASLVEESNAPVEISIRLQDDAYLPTDATSFYLNKVPILNAFTGAHADYHRPSDTPNKINYVGITKVVRLAARLARAASSTPIDYQKVDPPKHQGRGFRVYLGTIPDYVATDVDGVLLSDVASGGPAAQAGMRAKDIIVKVGDTTISNIYDYTYALQKLTPGKATVVTVRRAGKDVLLTLVPTQR